MPTTIQVDPAVRDRLRAYGTAGMTYNDILQRLMDEVDRQASIAQIRREMDEVEERVGLEDARWPGASGWPQALPKPSGAVPPRLEADHPTGSLEMAVRRSRAAMGPPPPPPIFFDSPAAFGRWLAANHASAKEVVVGFHKVGTGKPSLTWPESVDEALRFGWIDGVRKRIDEDRYHIRFTPRKPGSTWSAVNIRKAQALIASGRMRPRGLRAFQQRDAGKSRVYSYEQRKTAAFTAAEEKAFRSEAKAWASFQAQPQGYRRTATHWVSQPKRPETRQRRLEALIACAARGERIPQTDYDAWKRRAEAKAKKEA